MNNLTAHRKGLPIFWLHPRDHYHAVTQTYNNCAENHLGGGVMSPFVSPLSAITRAHDWEVYVALRKDPRRFCPHNSDCCHALMLTCRNLPLLQCCECCNNLVWPPWLIRTWSIEQRGHHVTCALIGTSHKLAVYNYTSSLALLNDAWVQAGGCKWSLPRYPKVREEPATRSAVVTWTVHNNFPGNRHVI